MVGPSVTQADRETFLRQLKIGFALLVGGSMTLITLWGGAGIPVVVSVGLGTAAVGRLLAEFTFPDSIAETPYEDDTDRGPTPGVRTQRRRSEPDDEAVTRTTDADGPRSKR